MTLTQKSNKFSIEMILDNFLKSNMNISPKALLFIEKLNLTQSELNNFIQNISFSPNFNSFIDYQIILKEFVNNEKEFKLTTSSANSKAKRKKENKNNRNKKDKNKKLVFEMPEPPNTEDFPKIKNSNAKNISKPNSKVNLSDNEIITETTSEINQYLIDKKNKKKIEEKKSNQKLIKNLEENKPEAIVKREIKKKKWEPLQIRRSTSTFKPIAKEYDEKIEILKDPTGKLFSNAKIEEFIDVQVDKFNKLKKILQKRPEGRSLLDINMINRLENSVEVKFIGMVVEKRQTSKKSYIIKFEDPSGICTTLVRLDPKQLYNLIPHLLPDNVVIVDGYLSVNKERNSRIILVNNIHFPDSPNKHHIQYPNEDLSICLISDTHFGSKDWLEKVWQRFVDLLNCKIGNDKQIEQAGKIKYLCIAGDIVDGIGVYPNQEKRLLIKDIYKQYEFSAELFSKIPDYIKIIISPGDHDVVRKAIPNPQIPKEFAQGLYDIDALMLGNPSLISLHGIKTQLYHGTSLIDVNMSVPGLSFDKPSETMRKLLIARDLAPTYGKKTEMAPVEKNWMILESLPDILHTGHLHKNGLGWHHGTLMVNSGSFQAQTDFQNSLGIIPDYGKPTIVNIKDGLTPHVIDLVGDY